MILIYITIFSLISQIILTNETNNNNSFIENILYELNDTSFDNIIQKGKNYRWLILFYSEINTNCTKAINEIKNIFNSFKDIPELRIAQIDINENIITKIRLNINKVPYIILLEKDTYYEMNLNLTKENLEDFIFTIFSEVKNDLKFFPEKVNNIYVNYIIYREKIEKLMNDLNQVLINLGIKIHFNFIGFIISFFSCIIFFIIFFYYFIKIIFNFCFSNNDEISPELKQLEEEFIKRKKEIEKEEKIINRNANINHNDQEEEEEDEEFEEEEDEEEEEDGESMDGNNYDNDIELKKLLEEKKRLDKIIRKMKEEKKKKEKEQNHKNEKNNNNNGKRKNE